MLKDDIKWDHFADGFPKLFIENVKDLAGRDGLFNLSIQSLVVFLSFELNLIECKCQQKEMTLLYNQIHHQPLVY